MTLNFCLRKIYSVFLRQSVLRNHVIISLQCVVYVYRYVRRFPIYVSLLMFVNFILYNMSCWMMENLF